MGNLKSDKITKQLINKPQMKVVSPLAKSINDSLVKKNEILSQIVFLHPPHLFA